MHMVYPKTTATELKVRGFRREKTRELLFKKDFLFSKKSTITSRSVHFKDRLSILEKGAYKEGGRVRSGSGAEHNL